VTAVCPSCGCAQPDGVLCHDDTVALETLLAAAPQLLAQLDVAVSKQARVGGGGKAGKGTAHLKEPVNWGAVVARDALRIELAFVGEDVNWVRRHPQAGEMLAKLGTAVKDAYRAIDRMQDRQYLGQCLYTEGELTCHAEIWAKPGAHQVTCTQCGITHEVGERRAWLMRQAKDQLFTVREIAQVIGSYGELRITESTIRSYISTGQLVYHGKAEGSGLVRLSELLDVIATHAAKPRGRKLRRAV
jgi:hypothetical protein